MSRRTSNREKGTGTIEKKRNHFYLKLRIGKACKTTLLLGWMPGAGLLPDEVEKRGPAE